MRALAALLMMSAPPFQLQWEEVASLPVGVVGHSGGMAGKAFVVAGGTWWPEGVKTWASRADWYDARRNRWLSAPALPRPTSYGPAAGGPGGLEIFGGNDGKRNYRECLVLDPERKRWRMNGSLPDDRLMAAAARVGRSVYLFGGCGDAQGLTDCSDGVLAREDGGQWTRAGAIPSGPVALAGIATAGGRIFLFGGAYVHPQKKLLNRSEAWAFDAAARKWKALRPLPTAARGITAAAVDDRYILLAGGYSGEFLRRVLVYDVARDAYVETSPLPMGVLAMAVGVDGRTVYLAGGEDRPKERSARVFRAVIPAGR